jgi:hypothetical protein
MESAHKFFLIVIFSLFSFTATLGQDFPAAGIIDFYGLRSVSAEKVRSVITIKAGDDWAKVSESMEKNRRLLKTLPNVEDASISLVCCDNASGKTIVFIGIREKGVSVLTFRAAPKGSIRLPENIQRAGAEFQTAFTQAIAGRDFSEDASQGHSLANNKNVRSAQEKFITLAAENLAVLRSVLRESSVSGMRALAAQIIAYTKDKREITNDLLFAAGDENESVRNNAIRALILIAEYASANPQLKIEIPADDFIKMLDSIDWTDRNKSLGVINALTKKRDSALLDKLKKNSLASLAEMARWKSSGHAQAAFYILGRVASFSETEIDELWNSADRESQVKTILEKINASK